MAISQLKAKFGRQQDGVGDDDSSSTNTDPSSGSGAEITYKCAYGEEIRAIKVHSNTTYDKFYSKIRSAFGHRMYAGLSC
jgi:hypothetical protein